MTQAPQAAGPSSQAGGWDDAWAEEGPAPTPQQASSEGAAGDSAPPDQHSTEQAGASSDNAADNMQQVGEPLATSSSDSHPQGEVGDETSPAGQELSSDTPDTTLAALQAELAAAREQATAARQQAACSAARLQQVRIVGQHQCWSPCCVALLLQHSTWQHMAWILYSSVCF